MKNIDMPAEPIYNEGGFPGSAEYVGADDPRMCSGLTKREYACIHCGVPNTGDPELNAIIAEGNRIQKAMIDPSFGDLN